jgi:hypothetical protein
VHYHLGADQCAAGFVICGGLAAIMLYGLFALGVTALIGAHSSGRATGTVIAIVQTARDSNQLRPRVEFATAEGITISFTESCLFPASVGDSVEVRYHRRWPQRTATLSPSGEIWHGIRVALFFAAGFGLLALFALGELIAQL